MFYSPLEQFDSVTLIFFSFFGLDFSFNNVLFPIVFINFLFFIIILFYKESFTIVPSYWQMFFEALFSFVLNILEEQTGEKGFIYFPFVFTLFNFILFCNLISLTPLGFALTSHIIMIFFLSWSIGLSSFIIGLYTHGAKFFQLFIPNCPLLLLPFLIVIEIFSYVIKFFSLAIRLSANIMAGHTLVHIMAAGFLGFSLVAIELFFSFYPLLLAILLLELGVAFLQAYVFIVLTSIYLSDSLNTPQH